MKTEKKDLSGRQFDRWTVQNTSRIRNGQKEWLCVCRCGTERYVNAYNLLHGKTHSCGCLSVDCARASAIDLTDQHFGLLTAKRRVENRNGRVCWECECKCGSIIVVTAHELREGKTKSCGCLRKMRAENNELIRDLKGMSFGFLIPLFPTQKRDKKGSAYWHCRCKKCGSEVDLTESQLVHGTYKSCGCGKEEYIKTIHQQLHFVDDTCVEWLEKRKHRCDNKSGFRGVTKRDNGRFHAGIGFRKQWYYLGAFDTFEEAVDSRLRAEALLHQAFVDGFREWQKAAEKDPLWAQENPYQFEHIENLREMLSDDTNIFREAVL